MEGCGSRDEISQRGWPGRPPGVGGSLRRQLSGAIGGRARGGGGGTLARALWEGRVGHDGSITDEAGACLGSVLCPALNKRP